MASPQHTTSRNPTAQRFNTCYILNLPTELLIMIVHTMFPASCSDLKSTNEDYIFYHVALQATCRRFRILYMDMEDLWQRVCTFHGWGRPQGPPAYLDQEEWPLANKSWRDMAIMLSGHVQSCPVYDCSERRVSCFCSLLVRNQPTYCH